MTSSKISIRTGKGIRVIECKDIKYCKADGRYTHIFLHNGESFVTAKVLKKYEELLSDNCFFRIHRSYLVNLDFVKEYAINDCRTLLLNDNTELIVSHRRCKMFTERVLNLFPSS